MSSIIQDLQIEATNPNSSVSDILRKAKIVAVKLDLKEFGDWIEKELNGYSVLHNEDLPKYRVVTGEAKAWNPYHGWQPIMFNDLNSAEIMSKRGVMQAIGELDDLIKTDSSTFMIDYNASAKKSIMEAIDFETDIKFMAGRSAITGILEGVRNLILDWALKLEKAGVIGEGISFSKKDVEKAQAVNTTYSIGHIENFAGAIGNISDQANVSIQQANGFSSEKVINLIDQIKKFLPEVELKSEESESVKFLTNELKEEISKSKPEQSKITTTLLSLKTIFEGAVSNIIAQGIIVEITKILTGN